MGPERLHQLAGGNDELGIPALGRIAPIAHHLDAVGLTARARALDKAILAQGADDPLPLSRGRFRLYRGIQQGAKMVRNVQGGVHAFKR